MFSVMDGAGCSKLTPLHQESYEDDISSYDSSSIQSDDESDGMFYSPIILKLHNTIVFSFMHIHIFYFNMRC